MGIQRFFRTMIFLVLLALAASVIFRGQLTGANVTKDMKYGTFYTKLKAGAIKSVVTTADSATVKLKDDEKITYNVTMPTGWLQDNTLTTAMHKATEPSKDGKAGMTWKQTQPWLSGNMVYLFSMLIPILLLGGFWFFMVKQSQAGAGQAMSFGKSKARRLNDSQPKVTFADVAGVEEAKQELTEIIDFLKSPEKFQALGAKIPKGVLLLGNPGTGKTLLARAVAGEAGVPFFHISGSDFVEMFVGVGASRVRDLFEQAKAHRPAIIFIDEIDAVGRQRGAGLGGGHDEREQTLNQLLVEMDGFDPNSGVILMAATNRADVLDPALVRPGRFDRRIVVDNPDSKGRLAILQVHAKGKPISEEVDLDLLARRTAGFSGADLANLLNEAALLTARRDKQQLGMSEFEESIERVVAGPERKSRIIQEREKSVLAYHEVGHALLGKLLPNTDSPHKVTILPRGMALGYTLTLPSEDRFLMSKSQMLDEITVLLGGRVAEQIVFNEITTGAQNDLQRCTDIARRMVCEYGMTEALGPLTLGHSHGPVFLGRDINEGRNYSEDVAGKIDIEIRAIVERSYDHATKTLNENREALDRIVVALLEKETITADELEQLMTGELKADDSKSSEASPPAPPAAKEEVQKGDAETKPAPDLRPGLAGA